ncbi:methyltransferase domain-containing protein [Streptomyces sp. NPDC046716]|uniref:class I SAM-dependent methyltransferase n=1 Tax=Streptomyces sp. NPDC046716 TaxID=3157093 RepID=UPI00340ECD31
MTTPRLAREIAEFYSDDYDEQTRLTDSACGVLELVRTQELLRRHLPPAPASVLDVGGGPGVHARWLAADGYRVHLVDPVERHVAQAREASAAYTVEVGDARALSAADASYDVVLFLGPLYHLPEPAERERALAQALRVVRPGGLVVAAGIQRFAPVFDNTAHARLHLDGIDERMPRILTTGSNAGKLFTSAYFHRTEELADELRAAGLAEVRVYGVEGPGDALLKAAELTAGLRISPDSDLFRSALAAARLAEPHPELTVASSHLLAFGRRPAQATAA